MIQNILFWCSFYWLRRVVNPLWWNTYKWDWLQERSLSSGQLCLAYICHHASCYEEKWHQKHPQTIALIIQPGLEGKISFSWPKIASLGVHRRIWDFSVVFSSGATAAYVELPALRASLMFPLICGSPDFKTEHQTLPWFSQLLN